MKLIDAHAHLPLPQFDEDRAEVIARARYDLEHIVARRARATG